MYKYSLDFLSNSVRSHLFILLYRFFSKVFIVIKLTFPLILNIYLLTSVVLEKELRITSSLKSSFKDASVVAFHRAFLFLIITLDIIRMNRLLSCFFLFLYSGFARNSSLQRNVRVLQNSTILAYYK